MNKNLCLIGLAALAFVGCNTPFKKTKDGMEYKVIANKSGKKAEKGEFMQLNILAKYKDSVLFSSLENGMPQFIPYDTAQLPPFFKDIHEGDSIIVRVSTDTVLKKSQPGAYPYMKKGQYLNQYFKVVKLFKDREAVDSVAKIYQEGAKAIAYKKTLDDINKQLKENAPLMKKEDEVIAAYLAKNNIQATKTAWGTYVAITTPGSGPFLSEKDIAEVNYTGRNLKDSIFDSNTDIKFGHVEPLQVNLGEFGVIPGWIDGLKKMQKGTVGKLIIPSTLAYGKQAKGDKIGADEILVFDITVTDLLNKEQFEAKQKAKQAEMMAKQQQMMEERSKMQEQMKKKMDSTGAKKK